MTDMTDETHIPVYARARNAYIRLIRHKLHSPLFSIRKFLIKGDARHLFRFSGSHRSRTGTGGELILNCTFFASRGAPLHALFEGG